MFKKPIKWIIRWLDKEIKGSKHERKAQAICMEAFASLGPEYVEDYELHRTNAVQLTSDINEMFTWRNRLARWVGEPTSMAW